MGRASGWFAAHGLRSDEVGVCRTVRVRCHADAIDDSKTGATSVLFRLMPPVWMAVG
jgi:hypothetical protein